VTPVRLRVTVGLIRISGEQRGTPPGERGLALSCLPERDLRRSCGGLSVVIVVFWSSIRAPSAEAASVCRTDARGFCRTVRTERGRWRASSRTTPGCSTRWATRSSGAMMNIVNTPPMVRARSKTRSIHRRLWTMAALCCVAGRTTTLRRGSAPLTASSSARVAASSMSVSVWRELSRDSVVAGVG